MYRILKLIYRFYSKPKNWIKYYLMQFFYFIYPNRINLLRHRIIYQSIPRFSQITICEGSGSVEIGRNCSFGFKMGGFHRGGSIELQARYVNSRIKIGNNIATNNNIMFCAANYIEIGDDTLIGQNVTIMDHEAHGIDPDKRRQVGKIGKVILGNNLWLGIMYLF